MALDPTEVSLGISMYMTPNAEGFHAVSKARYSDFIVHEVALDGRVARLTSTEPVFLKDVEEKKDVVEEKKDVVEEKKDVVEEKKDVVEKQEENNKTEIDLKRKRDSEQNDDDDGNDNKKISNGESTTVLDEATTQTINKPQRDEIASSIWNEIQVDLCDLVDAETASNVILFLQKNSSANHEIIKVGKNDEVKEGIDYVLLPAIKEKDKRKRLHIWIRERLSTTKNVGPVAADTIDNGCIRIWRSMSLSKMPKVFDCNPRNNNRMHNAQQSKNTGDRKRYIQFVLYKENMDTSVAIQQITRRMGPGGRSFGGRNGGRGGRGGDMRIRIGYAGNKDKRGITCQFVTVPSNSNISSLCKNFNSYQQKFDKNHVDDKNQQHGGGGGHTMVGGVGLMRVGNFRYTDEELQLGRLYGNRFDVVLRNVHIIGDEKIDTVTNEQQIVGEESALLIKLRLEKAAESIRINGFINYFGVQRFGKFHDTHLTGIAILQGNYEKAIDIIMSPKQDEKDYITDARNMWQNRFESIKDDKSIDEKQKATIEKDCASRVVSAMNRFMLSETSILNSLIRFPLDYKRAFSCITKTMRMMFIHAFQSFVWNQVVSYRIKEFGHKVIVGDLVLSNKDNESSLERNAHQIPSVHTIASEDVSSNKYTLFDIVMPLIGMKTKNPDNESGALFSKILLDHGITLDMIHAMDRDYNCAGDYRKIVCQPTDIDFQILEYTDELEPLLQTDYMLLQNIDVKSKTLSQAGSNRTMDDVAESDSCLLNVDESSSKNIKSTLYAMAIGFTLPSSSYATIFLRELMKRPTSSEYQKEQKLTNGVMVDVP